MLTNYRDVKTCNFCYFVYSTRHHTAGVIEREGSASLYHSRQSDIVLESRSDRIDYTVVSSVTHDCS